ncbi:MAG TPA: wax ester/triacylglycerol synthase family O-acyltransferase [Streptosporangiaceae bacterium]|nr:wax ester/triacylglycerol synthase family O-acyltransferase [Streptosporangiaceae bacterium]
MERLSAQDLVSVTGDVRLGLDIGAIGRLDGTGLASGGGRFRIEAVRRVIESRLCLVPHARQVLYRPGPGLGWPVWVDAAGFDIADHVRVCPLAAPAGQAQVLAACEQLRRRPLDLSRPRWQVWFLPGLDGGRVGVFLRVHHAMADGVAAVAAFGALFDLTADSPAPAAPPWRPAAVPSACELLGDNARRRARELGHALSGLADPGGMLRRARRTWPAWREALAHRAPRTSLNCGRIGLDRRLALVRGDLGRADQIARAHGGTVNDVVLAAVAGGLRDLLLARGEPVGDLVLRASVPVSLHQEPSGRPQGNRVGWMIVPLPAGEPCPARRLTMIAAESAGRKKNARPEITGGIFRFILAQRVLGLLLPYQRYLNMFITNVPGPPTPLYLAGAPLLEVFPVLPITGNMALGVAVTSYAGQLNLTAVADRDRCPDVEVFAEGVRRALDELAQPAGPAIRPPGQPAGEESGLPAQPACGRPRGGQIAGSGPATAQNSHSRC